MSSKVTVSIVTDLGECERLWKMFSPNRNLFDDWEYRSCFFSPSVHSLHFIVAKRAEGVVGVLPLWKHKAQTYYEWFGGEFAEHNAFFVKDEEALHAILAHLPEDVWLPYVENKHEQHITELLDAHKESTFYVDLEKHGHSLENYLSTFNKKHRKNVNRDLRILYEKHPNLIIINNRIEDFNRMMELNHKRFSQESFFAEKDFVDGLRKLIMVALERGELEMLSIHINGKPEAVEAAVLHNGTYTVLLGGNNLEFANIGKLMTIEHIKNAIFKGARIADFLAHDCGWKKLWNMDEIHWCEYSREP